MKETTLEDLHEAWLDSCWTMLVAAYEAGCMDASDEPQGYMDGIEEIGVDDWLYQMSARDENGIVVLRSWMVEEVDTLLSDAVFRATLYTVARDKGMNAATLFKLANGGAQ